MKPVHNEEVKKEPLKSQATRGSITLLQGVTQKDVEDPDNLANMTCMSYIEKRLAEQEAKVKQFAEEGVRLPPEEKDKLMALTRQKGAITGSINSGKLTEEKYKEYM